MIGTIANLSSGDKKGQSTMKIEIGRFVKFIAIQSSCIAVTLAIVGFIEGQPWKSVVINAFIGIFVANIPQGLPATVTSLLALTCANLAKKNVYVKQNEIVEALGSASVICSDKTGTLTQNRMRYAFPGGAFLVVVVWGGWGGGGSCERAPNHFHSLCAAVASDFPRQCGGPLVQPNSGVRAKHQPRRAWPCR